MHDLKQRVVNLKDQLDQSKKQAKENQEAATQLVLIQQDLETSQLELVRWQDTATQNHLLYLNEQQRYQQTLDLYHDQKNQTAELMIKYEAAEAQRLEYLMLYTESLAQLKYERRSKAGIKGWETRRKQENERLKKEIAEMTLLLHDSLERKEDAVNNLYLLADRMDRIQKLVDSVDEKTTDAPLNLLQKLLRVWNAIKEIMAE
jgi:hypothetical protein